MAKQETLFAKGALAGLRVVDLTWVRAGPQTTRILAMMGAQVIRVEWPGAPDVSRLGSLRNTPPGIEPGVNTSGDFNNFSANKLSCVLNIGDDRGKGLLRQLISVSDVVVENFSSRVLDNWGLDYENQRQINPTIIYVSMAGFGHEGRWRDYDTWGPAVQAMTGLTFLSGLPDKPPSGWGHSYMDHTGGYYGAMAVLNALHYRSRTGKGQYVDLAQVDAGCTLTGAAILDYTVNGRSSRRPGIPSGNRTTWPGHRITENYSRGAQAAPHNVYPTDGGGHCDWCVIVCKTDEHWQTLVRCMGSPDWAGSPQFATLGGRLEHQEELDERIGRWTGRKEKFELTDQLQAAGIPAAPVNSMSDRVERDPQLRHRGTFSRRMSHPILGENCYESFPAKFSETPWDLWRGGPLIGMDNEYIYKEICGLNDDQYQLMDSDGVLWPHNMQRAAT